MAYTKETLWPIGYGNGNSMWFYKTADTAATVDGADYFLSAINQIKLYDVILAVCDTGGTPQAYLLTCNANNGTAIDFTNGLALGTTDSD